MHAIHEIFPAVKYFPWTSWGFELNPSTLFEAKTFTLESGNPFVPPNKEPNMMSDYLSNGPFFIPIRFNQGTGLTWLLRHVSVRADFECLGLISTVKGVQKTNYFIKKYSNFFEIFTKNH